MKLAGAAVISLFLGGCVTDPPGDIAPTGPLERVGTYLTGAHPVTAVLHDVDGDGDQDLIAPALLTGDVVVIENRESELVWQQVGPLAVGAGEAITADVNGDGVLELVTTNRDLDRVDIYEIVPDPDLIHVQTLDVTGATGIVAADIDGDGDTDLAVTGFRDDTITVFEQRDGELVIAGVIATGAGPYALRAANIDDDGFLELVVTAATDSRVEIYAGSDWTWTRRAAVDTARWPSSLLVDDDPFGAPGTFEILGAATVGDAIFSIEVEPDESDTWPASYRQVGEGDGAFAIARFESGLAVTNKDASTVSLLSWDDDLSASRQLSIDLDVATGDSAGPTPLLAWDFNGDSLTDLIVVNAFTDEVVIYRGR